MRSIRAGVLAASLLAALGGCDQPGPLSKAARVRAEPAPDRPPPPAWAGVVLHAEMPAAMPNPMGCVGVVGGLGQRYKDAVAVNGWAWNAQAWRPVTRVVAVNRRGRIVGFGEGGRPLAGPMELAQGVPAAQAGWTLVTGAPAKNGVRIYGVDLDARASCLLGEIAIPY
ncbi:hypothetical protein [Phenylobacterium sp.]|jgi:hypothetical protein|uniref:hypothetical protein n=1 Tax=Phenylobacterium sp. TaxID=1871053 RepID=UPI002F91E0A0